MQEMYRNGVLIGEKLFLQRLRREREYFDKKNEVFGPTFN